MRLHLFCCGCALLFTETFFSYICDLNKSTRLHPSLHVGERIKDSHVDGGIYLYYLYLEVYFLSDSQRTVQPQKNQDTFVFCQYPYLRPPCVYLRHPQRGRDAFKGNVCPANTNHQTCVCLCSVCSLLWCSHTLQDAQIEAPGKSIKDMN